MAMIKCPGCGNVIDGSVDVCPNCGYRFESESNSSNQSSQPDSINKTSVEEKAPKRPKALRNCFILCMIVFALFAAVFFFRAHNVRTVYRNSTYYSTNAYVGGDAYNYIINGTYFTGYSVTASGCMISAMLCGVGAAVVGTKKK